MSRHSSTLLSFWHTIVIMAAVGLLLGVILSLLRPLEYSSTTRLLIIQQLGTVDAIPPVVRRNESLKTSPMSFTHRLFSKGDGLNFANRSRLFSGR